MTYLQKKLQSNSKEKGITLIALIITIIIIIILATITMNMAFGDSGLLDQATETQDRAGNVISETESNINGLLEEYESIMSGSTEVPDDWDTSKVTPVVSTDGVTVPVPVGYTASSATEERSVKGRICYI